MWNWIWTWIVLSMSLADESIYIVNAYSGRNLTLSIPGRVTETLDDITWLCTDTQKIAEWEGSTGSTYYSSFQNRTHLNGTGILYVSRVYPNDSNLYIVQITNTTQHSRRWSFNLQVFDPILQPPNITFNVTRRAKGCNVRLFCSGINTYNTTFVNYTWYSLSSDDLTVISRNESYIRNVTTDGCYTCQIQNPIERSNSTYCTSSCNVPLSQRYFKKWSPSSIITLLSLSVLLFSFLILHVYRKRL
ncbi:membrane protein S30 [Saimiriine betaherpesvirus 4]|uniref:Membrane protein S30 n=1 Tax=Saimiriine betaherpesvirus 4 TaxID=1535247 RepID=G8XT56_9BETA|nr:membrane protein S30 [Saimiriine betaherpesvirus 4]AEV81005.1 membrane protein S30 [Saimiriine betaherpesvirus 4]